MNRPTLSRGALLAAHYVDWLVLALLLVVSLPPILIHPHSLTVVSRLNLLDDSWLVDTSYKAAGGIWFGRDVAFTFGPLYQWLSSAPARRIGLSTGAILATSNTLPYLALILATFCTVRLVLPSSTASRRALLLLLAVVFWSPPDFRAPLCLLAFAIFLRLVAPSSRSAVAGTSRSTLATTTTDSMLAITFRAILAAATCLTAFLLSADIGIYAVAALLLCLIATALPPGRRHYATKFFLVAALSFFLLMLLTNALMLSVLNFTFWRSSLAIATAYRWFEPLAMAKSDKRIVLATLALGMVVFGAGWWRRCSGGPLTRRPAFLLAGFGFAVLLMQTALVRSDHGHVVMGVFPMIFLCGVIALNQAESDSRLFSLALPVATVIAALLLAHPFPMFLPSSMASRWHQIIHPTLACPAGMQEFDRACLPADDTALLTAVSTYVRANTTPHDTLAVFPYETLFGFASRRQVAGGVLQSYLVNGRYLTDLDLEGLRRDTPTFALYLPDGGVSRPLDGVPNVTRSPELWFYLLRHYRAQGNPASGVLALTRDDSRDTRLTPADERDIRLAPSEETVPTGTLSVLVNKRSASIDLGPVTLPSDADFLKLRLRVDYPFWWRFRKPSCLTLQMSFADGSQKSIQFVLEPNRTSDVWVYPWNEEDMGRYFSSDKSAWRQSQRPLLTHLRLLVTPFDWLSVTPTRVAIDCVKAVRLLL
jgi:hypothetical protein